MIFAERAAVATPHAKVAVVFAPSVSAGIWSIVAESAQRHPPNKALLVPSGPSAAAKKQEAPRKFALLIIALDIVAR